MDILMINLSLYLITRKTIDSMAMEAKIFNPSKKDLSFTQLILLVAKAEVLF